METWKTFRVFVVILGVLCSHSWASPAWDLQSLPGLDTPINFAQYAGMVNITHEKHLFYWFAQPHKRPSCAVAERRSWSFIAYWVADGAWFVQTSSLECLAFTVLSTT